MQIKHFDENGNLLEKFKYSFDFFNKLFSSEKKSESKTYRSTVKAKHSLLKLNLEPNPKTKISSKISYLLFRRTN